MRKVLHFIDSSGLYGAEQVILALSREMQKSTGFQPVVGCIVPRSEEEVALYDAARQEGIEAWKLLVRNNRFPLDLMRMAARLKKEKVNLIHSHGYKPSVFGFLLARCTGIPITTTCHLWYKAQNRPLKYRVMTNLEMYLYRFFKQVVAVSEPIKQQLMAGGVGGQGIRIVRNGIPSELFGRTRKKSLPEVDRDGLFLVLNVARLAPQKAQQRIVEAAEALKKRGRRVCFLILGEGESRHELEEAIRSKGLRQEVQLLGYRSDAAEMMASADLFVLPSMDEGLPISMLEAMASKLPVLATPVGEIPHLIAPAKTGLLVEKNDGADLAEKIEWAMDHPKELERIAEEAFQLVSQQYSSEKMFQVYKSIYVDLLEEKGSRQRREMGGESGQESLEEKRKPETCLKPGGHL